jgi:hypothetical protein
LVNVNSDGVSIRSGIEPSTREIEVVTVCRDVGLAGMPGRRVEERFFELLQDLNQSGLDGAVDALTDLMFEYYKWRSATQPGQQGTVDAPTLVSQYELPICP